MELEHIVWIAIVLNTIIQFYDIIICRMRDCGSKNHEVDHLDNNKKWW